MHGLRPDVADAFAVKRQGWLAEQKLPAATRESVHQILRLGPNVDAGAGHCRRPSARAGIGIPGDPVLQTMPGIGPILSPLIWSEIGQLDRFGTVSALAN
jgi:hypothetical protein